MKKSFLLLLIVASVFSCKKKDDAPELPYKCTACVTQPQALVAHDASSKGIYKGVVIGSSGTILFNISNASNAISAVMVLNAITVNLTSTVTWVAGQPFVAPFTGTLSGSAVSITFSVGASGGNPTVTMSSIPGHPNSTFTILKETSTSLIEAFEGTYVTTQPESGTFNLILSRSARLHSGASRKDGSTTSSSFSGTINANNQLMDAINTTRVLATLSGDILEGGPTITIKSKRTL